MTKIEIFTLTILVLISFTFQQNSLSEAKDYKNLNGTQIYMSENTNYFSYISINNDTSKLNATIYLYTKIDITSLSEGIYIGIGFGTSEMKGADIILCAALKDKNGWCKDYNGNDKYIVEKTSITSSVVFSWENAHAGFSPYTYKASWSFVRTMDVSKIISGASPSIWAYGSISGGQAVLHQKSNYGAIKTGDGNIGLTTGNSNGGNSFSIKMSLFIMIVISLIFM